MEIKSPLKTSEHRPNILIHSRVLYNIRWYLWWYTLVKGERLSKTCLICLHVSEMNFPQKWISPPTCISINRTAVKIMYNHSTLCNRTFLLTVWFWRQKSIKSVSTNLSWTLSESFDITINGISLHTQTDGFSQLLLSVSIAWSTAWLISPSLVGLFSHVLV